MFVYIFTVKCIGFFLFLGLLFFGCQHRRVVGQRVEYREGLKLSLLFSNQKEFKTITHLINKT